MAASIDPQQARDAVDAVRDWLTNPAAPAPPRTEIAQAVRLSARTLAQVAPGQGVELRVPPFVAVQCFTGPTHTRGNPPAVVETDPRTWLQLAVGLITYEQAVSRGTLAVSGIHAGQLQQWLPLF